MVSSLSFFFCGGFGKEEKGQSGVKAEGWGQGIGEGGKRAAFMTTAPGGTSPRYATGPKQYVI